MRHKVLTWEGLHVETLREVATRQGMRLLRETGLELLKRGVTSIEEVASAKS